MSHKKHTTQAKHLNKSLYAADLRRTQHNIYKKSDESLMSWKERMESFFSVVSGALTERRPVTTNQKPVLFSHLLFPHKHRSFIVLLFLTCLSFVDSDTLGYEETVIITVATVSVLAVLAVAAFFGYRMMHGELPWLHAVMKNFIIQGC